MGTDIHGLFQRRLGKEWRLVQTEYAFNRHYQLFAALAGVRNGTGFAGVPTGQAIVPIALPRGLPLDFTDDHDLGDHSFSWLTGKEMLAWKPPKVLKVGVLDREVYAKWDGQSQPVIYCGDIAGSRILIVNDNEVEMKANPKWTHVRCHWEQDLRDELGYFFREVARLQKLYSEIRFVFGFDS